MAGSIRDIYGETLAELGAEDPDIVVLDADPAGSTGSKVFGTRFPDRYLNMGRAEADMVACAAGLASVGKIPFVNTFAVFLTTLGLIAARTQICYGNLNVKLAGACCGLSDAPDGAAFHALEDIAVMRSLPKMRIIAPSDPESTRWAVRWAAGTYGPVYLRLSCAEHPCLYPAGTAFEAGRGRVVREGNDCTVFAVGIMVHKALEAAALLEAEGVSVQVVDLLSLKPIDAELIESCARATGAVVCAEEHQILGGAGSAVAEVLACAGVGVPTEFTGIRDIFTETGNYNDLLSACGLDAQAAAEAVRRVLERK